MRTDSKIPSLIRTATALTDSATSREADVRTVPVTFQVEGVPTAHVAAPGVVVPVGTAAVLALVGVASEEGDSFNVSLRSSVVGDSAGAAAMVSVAVDSEETGSETAEADSLETDSVGGSVDGSVASLEKSAAKILSLVYIR